MDREQVYEDIRQTLGHVPEFVKVIPDATLGLEWELIKRVQLEEGAVPNKYRELIGLAIAAVTKCRYCLYFHAVVARVSGATEAEIEDAMHYAKSSIGWSTYLTGMQTDYEQFKKDLDQIAEYVRSQQSAA